MIEGKKINLEALSLSDSEKILKWVNTPELKEMTGTVYPINELEHKSWFEKKLGEKTNKIFGIREKTSSILIGIIGFSNMDFINRSTDIYIYIGESEFRGQGLGSDSLETMIMFAFEELNLHRISLTVFSYNKKAINTYERMGFKTEGILKDALYKKGKYHDKIIMAILNEK